MHSGNLAFPSDAGIRRTRTVRIPVMPHDLSTMTRLPDGRTDPRGGETALAVALGGAICPVPFVMSAAALRIAGPGTGRAGRAARWVARATIALQATGLIALAVLVLA